MVANRFVISYLQHCGRGGDNSSQAQESRCAKGTSGNDHRSAKDFVDSSRPGKSKRALIRLDGSGQRGRALSISGRLRNVWSNCFFNSSVYLSVASFSVPGRAAHLFSPPVSLTILRVPHPLRRARFCLLRSEQRVGLSGTSTSHPNSRFSLFPSRPASNPDNCSISTAPASPPTLSSPDCDECNATSRCTSAG